MNERKVILNLFIEGHIRGGKNHFLVSSNGRHIPNKTFQKWRNNAIYSLLSQTNVRNYNNPDAIWYFYYYPADKRKRDITAILDAVFHCLERSGIITDDNIIKNILFFTIDDNSKKGLEIQCIEGVKNE